MTRIIDGHTHVASMRFIPSEFMEGVVDNIMEQMHLAPVKVARARVMDRILSSYQDHEADHQVREMDKLGIARAVLLLPDFTYALKGHQLTIEEMFGAHQRILERHPNRFHVFAGVDPRWGQAGLDLFVKGVEAYGFQGLKLYPPCGYRPDSELLTPFYEYCETRRLPVLIHIGATSPALSFAEAHPLYVDAPARRYRNINFILAHGAVNYQEQCAQLCKYRPNVYLDLSGAQRSAADADQAKDLIRLVSSGINHKIIFGTDWPINNQALMNSGLIGLLSGPDDVKPYISLSDSALILSGNMERILQAA